MNSVYRFTHQLRGCPLVHGFLNWPPGKSDAIRNKGLLAPGAGGSGFNSFDYDEILGRKSFVFLSTLRLYPDYAYGFGTFLLVDPAVLGEHGVEFALVDVAQLVDRIRWTLGRDVRPYPEWVRDPSVFDEIIEHEAQSAREAYTHEKGLHGVATHVPEKFIVQRICASESFRRYVRCYCLRQDEFFGAIGRAAVQLHCDLDGYFRRD